MNVDLLFSVQVISPITYGFAYPYLEIVELLAQKNVGFLSLGEPWADTTSDAGDMFMTIFAGITEFEPALIRERTKVGRQRAIRCGVKVGRPRKLSPEKQELALQLIEEGKSIQEVARTFQVDRSTIYRLRVA